MNQDALKQAVARAALDYVKERLRDDSVIGIGTGSTANYFIDYLAELRGKFSGAVASSEASAQRLQKHGIEVFDLNSTGTFDIYVDGADEANHHLELIKGGGAALTREKIVAACAREFVCIADESKYVQRLGTFPLPIEVIPMAVPFVSRQMVKAGGQPILREGFVTDNGNEILDVHNLRIANPVEMEMRFSLIPGVVTVGLFANRGADVLLIGGSGGVKTLQ